MSGTFTSHYLMAYLVRRLLHSAFLFLAVSLLIFALLAIAPGDFFTEMRLNPAVSAGSVEQLRLQRELDRPLPVRYLHWLAAVLHGDWGESLAYQVAVWPLLRVRAFNTLLLTVSAMVVSWLMALALGIWVAISPGRALDRIVMFATSSLQGVPDIMISLLLLTWAVRSHLLPAGGMASLDYESFGTLGRMGDTLRHLLLPLTALVIVALPALLRHVRASMIDALAAQSVRTAQAAGVRSARIVLRHALPLASNPLISLLGLSIAGLLSGSLLIEWIMGWPGLGPLLLEAILARDVYVVIGAVMLSTIFLVLGNLFADMLLVAADPRMREERP
jgi:peptide/nickel transport system permease protein